MTSHDADGRGIPFSATNATPDWLQVGADAAGRDVAGTDMAAGPARRLTAAPGATQPTQLRNVLVAHQPHRFKVRTSGEAGSDAPGELRNDMVA